VSINATVAVDLIGQCASETVAGSYYSASGGQADFARRAMYFKGGQAFVVLHSTAKDGTISKIVPPARHRRRGNDPQEHGRQGGHRVGGGRAAGPLDPRASCRANRHRPSRPARSPRVRRHSSRLLLAPAPLRRPTSGEHWHRANPPLQRAHHGFFTKEALTEIAETTLANRRRCPRPPMRQRVAGPLRASGLSARNRGP
jgi:hypothetical protein